MSELGLKVAGLVMGKNHYPGDAKLNKQPSWSIDVAVPGCRELMVIKVTKPMYESVTTEDVFEAPIGFRTYKGATYYEAKGE